MNKGLEKSLILLYNVMCGGIAMKILLIEDNVMVAKGLIYSLNQQGYEVIHKLTIQESKSFLKDNEVDIIILDISLPDGNGFDLYQDTIKNINIPTIFLTAKDEEIDKILGLELGADDYITKPFSVRELMARIKANLRKSEINEETKQDNNSNDDTNKIIIGQLTLDLDKIEARVNDEVLNLTLREFEVLKYIAQQAGQIVTREKLLETVWGYEYYGDIRTVDVTVRRIRGKIEKIENAPKILATKRGVGYYIKTQ